MKRYFEGLSAVFCALVLWGAATSQPAQADAGHSHKAAVDQKTMEEMMDIHRGHEHEHDFEALKDVSPEDVQRVARFMMDIGLALPPMDSRRGREIFLKKGCVVCHAVNGVGGSVGPSLNAKDMPAPMNAFAFAARMWRGAPAMVQLQQDLLGEIIELNGQELADIIAFAHDGAEQENLRDKDIPAKYRDRVVR